MNLFEPWILLRLLAGLTASCLFARAALTAVRVLGHFDVQQATEGQLALERHMELAATFVRAGAILQVGALALSVLAADRLSHSIRGAMCAYGVFESPWGFASLGVTAAVALAAGVTAQLCAFDRRLRGLAAIRPIAVCAIVMAPLAALDLASTAGFLLRLDLGAMVSCCSVSLDVGTSESARFAAGSRDLATWGGIIAVALGASVAWLASRRPRALETAVAAALSLAAAPLAIDAAVLVVAPHAFELPQHTCPFCLLHADVLFLGYPLFGAIFLAAVWSLGAGVAGLVAPKDAAAREAFNAFARVRLRRGAAAWVVAAAVGVSPILHHALASGGRSLFP